MTAYKYMTVLAQGRKRFTNAKTLTFFNFLIIDLLLSMSEEEVKVTNVALHL